MRILCNAVLCALFTLTPLFAQNAAPPQPPTEAGPLEQVLVSRVDSFMHAWKQQDAVALGATMAPEFLYATSRGVTGKEGVVSALTHVCTLTSYRLSDLRMVQISPDSAALIYKIHQSASCAGHPEPAVVLNTDTLVRREGNWVFLLTTSTVAE